MEILADVHGHGDKNHELVQLEFEEIKQQVCICHHYVAHTNFNMFLFQVIFEKSEGAKSYFDLLKGNIPRRVFLGSSLQMWSQLSGMNVMMYVSYSSQ